MDWLKPIHHNHREEPWHMDWLKSIHHNHMEETLAYGLVEVHSS